MAPNGRHEDAGLMARMMRIWQAARSIGENPLPRMSEVATPTIAAPEFALACDSLFALTEAVLGRSLSPAPCCSPSLSHDEAAVMAMLACAPVSGTTRTGSAVPHGLPGALRWAAFAVARALGYPQVPQSLAQTAPERCPFRAVSQVPPQLGWAA